MGQKFRLRHNSTPKLIVLIIICIENQSISFGFAPINRIRLWPYLSIIPQVSLKLGRLLGIKSARLFKSLIPM